MKALLYSLAALSVLVSTPSVAATIIQTDNLASTGTGTTTHVSFAKFDPSLGTLESVTLSFDADMSANGTLKNNARIDKTTDLSEGVLARLAGHGFGLDETLGSGSEDVSVPGKTTLDIGPFSGSGSDSDTLTSSLSHFEGPGNIRFRFRGTDLFDDTGGVQLSIAPLITGDVTLTYNYVAAAPEPATWAILGVGIFGLGGALRHRRRTATDAASA
jgi:hypothetical protein